MRLMKKRTVKTRRMKMNLRTTTTTMMTTICCGFVSSFFSPVLMKGGGEEQGQIRLSSEVTNDKTDANTSVHDNQTSRHRVLRQAS